jgi:hypothetical protein
MDLSRRQLAAVLTGAAAAQAQTPSDPDLEAARQLQRVAAQTIARVPLPMTTEPAVHFKA